MNEEAAMATRPDGWPLCPKCGEDEVYCTVAPTSIDAEMRCYQCGWSGTIKGFRSARGAVPAAPGAERAEDIIRRMRDNW